MKLSEKFATTPAQKYSLGFELKHVCRSTGQVFLMGLALLLVPLAGVCLALFAAAGHPVDAVLRKAAKAKRAVLKSPQNITPSRN